MPFVISFVLAVSLNSSDTSLALRWYRNLWRQHVGRGVVAAVGYAASFTALAYFLPVACIAYVCSFVTELFYYTFLV